MNMFPRPKSLNLNPQPSLAPTLNPKDLPPAQQPALNPHPNPLRLLLEDQPHRQRTGIDNPGTRPNRLAIDRQPT
jgi:hypothetical protein